MNHICDQPAGQMQQLTVTSACGSTNRSFSFPLNSCQFLRWSKKELGSEGKWLKWLNCKVKKNSIWKTIISDISSYFTLPNQEIKSQTKNVCIIDHQRTINPFSISACLLNWSELQPDHKYLTKRLSESYLKLCWTHASEEKRKHNHLKPHKVRKLYLLHILCKPNYS